MTDETSAPGPMFTVPDRARATLRRSIVVALVLGGLALVAGGLYGNVAVAAFACLGLALGVANSVLVQRSIIKESNAAEPSRASLMRGVGGRLAMITLVAVVLALVFFPDGLGTFLGLAVFQVISTVAAALPALKEVRR